MNAKILETENVTVSFDGFKALNQLNFSMDVGELRVVIGPNGAGKTTFLDVITGKVQPTIGRVLFKGKNLRSLREHQIARRGIGRKFQTPRVYLNLTPRENLEITSNRKKNVFSTLFGRSQSTEENSIKGFLYIVWAFSFYGRKYYRFIRNHWLTPYSRHTRIFVISWRKATFRNWKLVGQSPDLYLVDEPVAGLTDEETYNIGELLLTLAQSHSILVIEHDMEFVRQIAKKVTVLHEGSVLCEGNFEEVQNDPRVVEVYLGQQ
nr:putative ATP-binding subunit [Nostoc sp. PCC 7120 = FACHB-418]